jgi:hypothetical protein
LIEQILLLLLLAYGTVMLHMPIGHRAPYAIRPQGGNPPIKGVPRGLKST